MLAFSRRHAEAFAKHLGWVGLPSRTTRGPLCEARIVGSYQHSTADEHVVGTAQFVVMCNGRCISTGVLTVYCDGREVAALDEPAARKCAWVREQVAEQLGCEVPL